MQHIGVNMNLLVRRFASSETWAGETWFVDVFALTLSLKPYKERVWL